MSERILPGHLPVGTQLGVGVRSGAIYIPGRKHTDEQAKWVDCFEENFVVNLSRLHIFEGGPVIDHSKAKSVSGSSESDEDGLIDSDSDYEMDDEACEHWRNALLTKLNWDSLSPEIPKNFQPLKDVEYENNPMYDIRPQSGKPTADYIPGGLISNLSHSGILSNETSKKMKGTTATTFDPTFGDLFVIGSVQTSSDLRNGNDQHRVMAYCSGRTKTILNLAVLKVNYSGRSNQILTKDDIGEPLSIDLKSTIKTIKFPLLSSLLGRNSDCVGVITENALHVTKIDSINSRSLEISNSFADALPFSEFGDFPFVDLAFNPWDLQQFAIVDIKGNFGVGRIPKSCKRGNKIRLSRELGGSIFDAEELSNWKKIEWSSSHDRLLVMDRSQIVELNFEQDWQLQVVQAKTWSDLRDYRKLDDDFGVILTSAEIIVIRTADDSEHIVREISWKHDLDPRDPTLRLALQKVEYNSKCSVIACIFSKCHNIIYVHGFCIGESGSLIQSTKDSAILEVPGFNRGFFDVCFLDIDEAAAVRDEQGPGACDNVKLHILINQSNEGKLLHVILSDLENDVSDNERHVHFGEVDDVDSTDKRMLEKCHDLGNIVPRITSIIRSNESEDNTSEISDDAIFQNYGYNLSAAINRLIRMWGTSEENLSNLQPLLKDLVEIPKNFKNIGEFNSFLEQLFNHYMEQNISFTKFDTFSNLMIHEEVDNLEVFYNKILQCWDLVTSKSELLTQEVFKSLLWSAIRISRPSLYEKISVELHSALEEPYAGVLSGWDDTYDTEDLAPASSLFQVASQTKSPPTSQSQIPTIKSSQQRASKRAGRGGLSISSGRISKPLGSAFSQTREVAPFSSQAFPNTLPDTMTPAFTLMQPLSVSASQPQSSQRSKKKKKRVGGFG